MSRHWSDQAILWLFYSDLTWIFHFPVGAYGLEDEYQRKKQTRDKKHEVEEGENYITRKDQHWGR